MDQIEEYLQTIAAHLKGSASEQGERLAELRDHLRELANDMGAQGYSTEESARLACVYFGDPHEIGRGLEKARRHFIYFHSKRLAKINLFLVAVDLMWSLLMLAGSKPVMGLTGGVVGFVLTYYLWVYLGYRLGRLCKGGALIKGLQIGLIAASPLLLKGVVNLLFTAVLAPQPSATGGLIISVIFFSTLSFVITVFTIGISCWAGSSKEWFGAGGDEVNR
ncbi:MAG: permease prefix domain 1-containing protein [Clostridia bacterium]|nr:permease prefix domain 1-containing protein [Clostridia bacterium]